MQIPNQNGLVRRQQTNVHTPETDEMMETMAVDNPQRTMPVRIEEKTHEQAV